MSKKISFVLAFILLVMPFAVFAEEKTKRDETVYASLDPTGKIRSVEVIVHRGPTDEEACDYGAFRNFTLFDGVTPDKKKDALIWKKGMLNRDTYYSVTSDKKPPVDISITYTLDGKVLAPQDIAGKTGDFKIAFTLKKSDLLTQISVILPLERFSEIRSNGMESVVGKNTRITITHLGNEEKTYEITGKVKDFALEPIQISSTYAAFDLSNFGEIETLSDGIDALTRAASDLSNGSGQLRNGANELAGGSVTLAGGMNKLVAGHHMLTEGFDPLVEGLTEYTNGVELLTTRLEDFSHTMEDKLQDLKKLEKLSKALSEVNEGLGKVEASLAKIVEGRKELGKGLLEYQKGLKKGLQADKINIWYATLESIIFEVNPILTDTLPLCLKENGIEENQAKTLSDNISALILGAVSSGGGQVSEKIENQDQNLNKISDKLLNGFQQLIDNDRNMTDGEEQLLNGFKEARAGLTQITAAVSGIKIPDLNNEMDSKKLDELAEGGKKLREGLEKLRKGTVEFDHGLIKVSVGMDELSSGSVRFASGVEKLNDGINAFYTSGMIPLRDGIAEAMRPLEDLDGKRKTSFLEAKNPVDSVVYVFVTDAIEKEEQATQEESIVEEQEHETFWQRLLNLFR